MSVSKQKKVQDPPSQKKVEKDVEPKRKNDLEIEYESDEEDETEKQHKGIKIHKKDAEMYPKTVFIKELPEDYSFSEILSIIEKYGEPIEMHRMDDGALLVRFESGLYAKRLVGAATGKKGNKIRFHDKQLHIFPKRERGSQPDEKPKGFKKQHQEFKDRKAKYSSKFHPK